MCTRLASTLVLALLIPLAGCDDTFISVSTDGRIEVFVNTSGPDTDTRFGVSVDGGAQQIVTSGATATLLNLSEGSHSVLLFGLANNCRVVGANPRTVVVGSDGTGSVAFQVSCTQATIGSIEVIVATTGASADPDGYRLAVAGGAIRDIGASARETFEALTPGIHLVTLKDVDPPCAVIGSNPRPVTAIQGQTVTVEIAVSCGPGGPPPAALR